MITGYFDTFGPEHVQEALVTHQREGKRVSHRFVLCVWFAFRSQDIAGWTHAPEIAALCTIVSGNIAVGVGWYSELDYPIVWCRLHHVVDPDVAHVEATRSNIPTSPGCSRRFLVIAKLESNRGGIRAQCNSL